jgi:hypothetical protein
VCVCVCTKKLNPTSVDPVGRACIARFSVKKLVLFQKCDNFEKHMEKVFFVCRPRGVTHEEVHKLQKMIGKISINFIYHKISVKRLVFIE